MSLSSHSHITQPMAVASLPSLPSEILCHISKHLSYGSHLALSFTCRNLYYKVDAPCQPYNSPVKPLSYIIGYYTLGDLLEIENWPENNPSQPNSQHQSLHLAHGGLLPYCLCADFFACRDCRRLRSATKFLCPAMGTYSWTDHTDEWCIDIADKADKRHERSCIPCDIAQGWFFHGLRFEVAGREIFLHVCGECRDFELVPVGCEGLWICDACTHALDGR